MRKLWRVIETILAVVLVLAAAGAGAAWYFARSSLPAYSAALALEGLDNEVTIYRDDYGVPHIYAQSLHDVFYAQGFVHAQDRLWEMDLSRRATQGRLSEVFGSSYVDADRFLRTIGFYRAAEASLVAYSPEVTAAAQAYADGVNAFITQEGGKLPIEFSVLGYEPDPWLPTDSAAIGKYMAWILGDNMQSELFYQAVVDKLGAEKASSLFPVYPADGPVITQVPYAGFETTSEGTVAGVPAATAAVAAVTGSSADVSGLLRLMEVATAARLGLPPAEGAGLGSNNWAVSGRLTRTGKPLLANDMHLEIQAPSIWYQNHLSAPDGFNVTGVIFPGVPGVIVGHNERIAWGCTNTGPDVQDLYVEKANPANPREFEYDGKWEPAQVFPQTITVKGQTEPVTFEVLVTRHGPIISGVVSPPEGEGTDATAGDSGGKQGLSTPLALRWTALDATSELAAVIAMDKAANWQEFKTALEQFQAPTQNFIFADVDGNIAYRSNGRIPIRSAAARQAGNGLLPVPGWSSAYEWESFIPWDMLPALYNPPSGVIVTANNRAPGDTYPYFISYAWASPYRAASIWQELRDRDNLGPEDMQAIQNDYKNLQATRLGPALAQALAGVTASFTTKEKAAWDVFAAWAADNPEDLAASPGPAIFHTFYLEALRATFADELGEGLYGKYLEAGSPTNTFDAMLLAGTSAWFDDVTTTDKTETMADALAGAFRATVAKLDQQLGGEPSTWRWGKLHTVTFDHPMGSVSLLRPFFNRGPYEASGSGVTAGAMGFGSSGSFAVESAAPWRFVADLSDLAHSFDVVAIGISGQPFSSHYADQMSMWLGGQYKEMLFDRAEIEAVDGLEVTVLKPGP